MRRHQMRSNARWQIAIIVALLAVCTLAGGCASGAPTTEGTGKSGSAAKPIVPVPAPPTNPAQGQSHLPPGFYGVNFDIAGFESFAGVDTGPLLKALQPSTIRWPGGTGADFYDWHSGRRNENKPDPTPFTLEDLAGAVRATGAAPICDLNVLDPANRTNPADQIEMLKAASQLGLSVRYVEIGNELYSNGPGFAQAFPNGADYAHTVSIYVRALHEAFPGVQVAADAIPFASNPREQSWDEQFLAAAVGPGAPDALVVHFYPGLYFTHPTPSDLPEEFADIYSSIAELSQAVRGLGGKPVWLTEYNFRGPYELFRKLGPSPLDGDFAHELYLAAFAAMLPRVGGLALVDNWTAFSDGSYGAWQDPTRPYLSPGGQAVEMVDTAAKGATTTGPVSLKGVPSLPGGYQGLVGQYFLRPGGRATAVLVNLTSTSITVPAQVVLAAGTRYEQVSGDPLAHQAEAVVPRSGTIGASGLVLPPYSVTIVGSEIGAPSASG